MFYRAPGDPSLQIPATDVCKINAPPYVDKQDSYARIPLRRLNAQLTGVSRDGVRKLGELILQC